MLGIYLGSQNSGKTLSMVYNAYKYFKVGYDIYSNFNLSFKHTKLTKQMIEEFVKGKQQFSKSIFLIDEIYLFMDSRTFASKRQQMLSYFILQTSKRNVNLFGTAQYFNSVEKRFRENTNFMCHCQRVLKNGNKYLAIQDNARFLVDSDKLYIKNSYMIKKSGLFETYDIKHYYLKAKPIFKLYDTTELLAID